MAETKAARSVCVESTIPILNVKSVPASVRSYVEALGFKLDWTWGDQTEFASVSRDGHAIMLRQDGQGQPGTWLWIGVDDIEPLFQDYVRNSVNVLEPTHQLSVGVRDEGPGS